MTLHFILNDRLEGLETGTPGLLLDYLRDHRALTGAKPGCREGDCGACAVLLGQWDDEGCLRYRLINSCLMPLAALQGCHVMTVEGLGSALTPVQRALVEEGGVQCGYCTPGMVMALTAYLLCSPQLDGPSLVTALDGNLCRCTGYLGIKRAGEKLRQTLADLPSEPMARLPSLILAGVLPHWLAEIPQRLAALPRIEMPVEPEPGAQILAGGTDWLIHHGADPARQPPWLATARPELHGMRIVGKRVSLGATTTMQELLDSQPLAEVLPSLHHALRRVASTPVRDRATVGGNLVNASPIGDLSVLLLALDAELLLHHRHQERRLPLSQFFLGYKQLALAEGEILAAVEFDLPAGLHFEKVAHREHLDIASVNCAVTLELAERHVRCVRCAAGGVAPIPLRLPAVEACLTGQELTPALVSQAARLAAESVQPISDLRGSAHYKRLLLGRLLTAGLLGLAPFLVAEEVLG